MCLVILCFLYFLFYAAIRIKMHHLAMGRGHEIFFSRCSKAAFSYHHTTKAVRNLAFSYTPAIMQIPNACMTTLAVNSNEKSTKTISSSIISFLQLFLSRQAIYFYIIATSVCADFSYKWNTSKTLSHHLPHIRLLHKLSRGLLLDLHWNILISEKWTQNMGLLLNCHWSWPCQMQRLH